MTMLGAVTLSDHLILGGLEAAPGVGHSARRTLGGRMYVQVGPSFQGGRTLTLEAENHFSFADINAVKALESAGLPVALVHHRGAFTVLVTGVEVESTFNYADPTDEDWYSGTITLIEI